MSGSIFFKFRGFSIFLEVGGFFLREVPAIRCQGQLSLNFKDFQFSSKFKDFSFEKPKVDHVTWPRHMITINCRVGWDNAIKIVGTMPLVSWDNAISESWDNVIDIRVQELCCNSYQESNY